jgi:hypothetical protein
LEKSENMFTSSVENSQGCPQGHIPYASADSAWKTVKAMSTTGKRKKMLMAVYKCKLCGKFHLSSSSSSK